MTIGVPLAKDILSRPAQFLLLGAFGVALILAIRRGEGIATAFERYAVGFFAVLFYPEALKILFQLGGELDQFLSGLGDREGLNMYVARALMQSATHFGSDVAAAPLNMLQYLTQILRTGVWGVLSSITELVFLLARFLLEVSRDALWQILFVLFPMGASLYPVFPKILGGMALLAVELCLWIPVLTIVNVTTSLLAREYATNADDVGFYVLACELVAIILTLSIPAFVHKMLSGALTGDVLGSWSKTLALVATVASKGKLVQKLGQGVARTSASAVRGRGRYFGAVLLCLIPGSAFAASALQLPVGYIIKATCHGRLLISAVGDEQLVELSALPRELGCGVLLKPKVERGKTNLILETTSGTVNQVVEITKNAPRLLEVELKEARK
jgi:hypothetical protein